jgi:hypothetical protein
VNTCAQLTPQKHEKSYVERATQQSYSYSLAGALMHTKMNFTSPLSIYTSQFLTTSLSSHLLGCLIRDSNYGPWQVTVGSNWQTCIRVHCYFGADWKYFQPGLILPPQKLWVPSFPGQLCRSVSSWQDHQS